MRLLLKKGVLKFSLVCLHAGYALVGAPTGRGKIQLLETLIQQKWRIEKW